MGQKGVGPFEKPGEMSHYMFCPPKKNNIPDFQNQRYINSYYVPLAYILHLLDSYGFS